MHIYTDANAPEQTLISTYEGSDDTRTIVGFVRATRAPIKFDAQLRPDNHGILLRRTSDQAAGYQSATVAVDGVPAGNWLQPRSNTFHRWLEDTYLVPEFLTAGKTRITITLAPTPSAPPWTASRYRVETLTGP
jgi:hypothetical protein